MAIKMIDVTAADATLAKLTIGQEVELTLDGVKYVFPIVKLGGFFVDVKTPTNNLAVPIEYLSLYQQELAMGRAPMPSGLSQPARRPGRPPGPSKAREPQAPVEMRQPGQEQFQAPQEAWVGQTYASAEQEDGARAEAASRAAVQAQAQASEQPRPMTIEEATGSENWIDDAVDNMMNTLRNTMEIIVDGIQHQERTKSIEVQSQQTTPKTCWNCLHVDIENEMCGYFKVAPPMSIICNAQKNCADFIDDSSAT